METPEGIFRTSPPLVVPKVGKVAGTKDILALRPKSMHGGGNLGKGGMKIPLLGGRSPRGPCVWSPWLENLLITGGGGENPKKPCIAAARVASMAGLMVAILLDVVDVERGPNAPFCGSFFH